jgi:hypothetical protein
VWHRAPSVVLYGGGVDWHRALGPRPALGGWWSHPRRLPRRGDAGGSSAAVLDGGEVEVGRGG